MNAGHSQGPETQSAVGIGPVITCRDAVQIGIPITMNVHGLIITSGYRRPFGVNLSQLVMSGLRPLSVQERTLQITSRSLLRRQNLTMIRVVKR